MSAKYTTIPVFINSDYNSPIGEMTIDMSQLPNTADFCFAFSYMLGVRSKDAPDTYNEIVAVYPVKDQQYLTYLEDCNARNNKLP